MRTRFLIKMTNDEVEEYLKRNDLIYVPLGTIESHALFPVDAEMTFVEAIGKVLAEKTDGLCLSSLAFTYCGATTISPGTVQMSVEAGAEYIKEVVRSLLRQGFRRIVFLHAHGPLFMTISTVLNDLFQETGIPMGYIERIGIPDGSTYTDGKEWVRDYNLAHLGFYRILNKLDEIVIDPDVEWALSFDAGIPAINESVPFDYINKFAHYSGAVGFYLGHREAHYTMYGRARSKEEVERLSIQGEKLVRELIDQFDIEGYVEGLRRLDQKINGELRQKYPHLPPFWKC